MMIIDDSNLKVVGNFMIRLVFIFTLLITVACNNQVKSQVVDLEKLETITKNEKLKLMDELKPQFEYLASKDTWKEDNLKDFHFVDLDHDSDKDLIFTGWSGAEPVWVRILMNQGGTYKEVFHVFQSIKRMEFRAGRLSHLTIEDPGCCAEYVLFVEDYRVDAKQDQLMFKLTNRTALVQGTEVPRDLFATPISFSVLNDKYFMRSSPKLDTVDQYYYGEPGIDNIIAEFKKGTRGKSLAEQTDNTGRVWWFVEIDPKFRPVNSKFYDLESKPTKLRGWMSSKYLKAE